MGPSETNLPRQTILIVEDAEPIRKMVSAMLSREGYRCLEAGDGTEALEIVGRPSEIHLVLTDIIMPHMGGAELARQLATLRPEVRIIFMSGYAEDPLVRRFEQAPAIFLPKPFTATALTHKVKRALEEPWTGLPDHVGVSS